jgi:hypothetical protein
MAITDETGEQGDDVAPEAEASEPSPTPDTGGDSAKGKTRPPTRW